MNLRFIGWNILLLGFVLYLVLSLITILSGHYSSVQNGIVVSQNSVALYVGFFLYSILVIGLFGYTYKKNILKKYFWKLSYPLIVVWGVLQSYNTLYRSDTLVDGVVVLAVYGIPCVLAYVAVFKYAYVKSNW